MPRPSAPLLATLPIHPDQRIGETPSIRGALRFHIVTTQQEMERGFDAPALAAALSQPDRTFMILEASRAAG
jgi:hypothetical protein